MFGNQKGASVRRRDARKMDVQTDSTAVRSLGTSGKFRSKAGLFRTRTNDFSHYTILGCDRIPLQAARHRKVTANNCEMGNTTDSEGEPLQQLSIILSQIGRAHV